MFGDGFFRAERNMEACVQYNTHGCEGSANLTDILSQIATDSCDMTMDDIVADYGQCEAPFVGTCGLYTAVDLTVTGILEHLNNDDISDICAYVDILLLGFH